MLGRMSSALIKCQKCNWQFPTQDLLNVHDCFKANGHDAADQVQQAAPSIEEKAIHPSEVPVNGGDVNWGDVR